MSTDPRSGASAAVVETAPEPARSRSWLESALTIAVVALIYFAAGKLGLRLAFVNASATAVWPAAGIALAAYLLFGSWVWPGVLIGAFLVNVTTAGSVATSIGISIGNTLEGLIGSLLIRRFGRGVDIFDRPSGVFLFAALAGLLAPTVSATIGTSTLSLGGFASWSDFRRIWLTWWLGDAAGILVVAPFLLFWARDRRRSWRTARLLELVVLMAVLVAVGALAFGGVSPLERSDYPLQFLCFPVLAWAAFRFTQRVTSTAMILFSAIAIWGTLDGIGPFHRFLQNESLLLLQSWVAVTSVTFLAVAAAVVERDRVEISIRRLNEELEDRVARRTAQIRAFNDELRHQALERLHAQQELVRTEARLREAQQLAHIGSWEWDIRTNLVWWSDELYALYGLDKDSFGASYEAFLERVHPDDRATMHRTVTTAVERAQFFSIEHRIVRPNGEMLTLLARGTITVDEEGRPIRMAGTGQDITERKAAEAQREILIGEQIARREAEEANRMKDEFLATLSHELRTPLNAIVGWADVMRERHSDPDVTLRAIETIKRNAHIQSQLIADILDSSRIALGRLELVMEPLDPCEVLNRALDTMRPTAQLKNIALTPELERSDTRVLGDPDRLQQVVWNLLSNAIKFTPEGGCIRVSIATVMDTIRVRVEDDGPGIDPKLLPYIFDRFRQGDSSSTRKHGGLGLGLAIVRHLVHLHGGSVSASNGGDGGGAMFEVALPVAGTTRPITTARVGSADRDGHDPPSLAGVRIVVVEDDDDSREVVAVLLETSGATVWAASSCGEALAILDQRTADVLISDIEMPGENGYDLIRRVRALPVERGGAIPAIALTAYAGAENAARALSCGYQAHLAKPVEFPKLVRTVAHLTRDARPISFDAPRPEAAPPRPPGR